MKKVISIMLVAVISVISLGLISCSGQVQSVQTTAQSIETTVQVVDTSAQAVETTDDGKNAAIEEVKESLTSDVKGSFKAVAYERGYVVNFDDMAYWYVEDGVVWSLNGFAKTYAANTEYKYGIEWGDLF